MMATHKSLTGIRRPFRDMMIVLLRLAAVLYMGFFLAAGSDPSVHAAATADPDLGANKFDLLLQYIGRASGGDGSPAYRRVTRAMGEKAIRDGKDVGFTFFRVSVTGYAPSQPGSTRTSDLGLWQTDPHSYWVLVDTMFDDLDRNGIRLVPTFVWNVGQFPALANESVGTLIRDPLSKSRMLLDKYIEEFIGRYKTRKTILFYELSNELNLYADLDLGKLCMDGKPRPPPAQCAVMTHFTTEDMIAFSTQVVSLIKRLDSGRSVSSGYGLPRQSARHLELQPGFSPKGPDWHVDTIEQLQENLSRTQAIFDIVSIHVYASTTRVQYGDTLGHAYELIADISAVARAAHKQVFLGEFGDVGDAPFMVHIADAFASNAVDYAAVWVWEFFQYATNQSFKAERSPFNLEPGFTDDKISRLKTVRPTARILPSEGIETAPRVVLTWPLPCSRVDRNIELSAVASATGLGALDRVDFLVDRAIVGTAVAPPYRVTFSPAPLGDKVAVVAARAVDRDGRSATFGSLVLLNRNHEVCAVAGN